MAQPGSHRGTGGKNLYVANRNNCISYVDPLGDQPDFIGPKCPCGPDITQALKLTMLDIAKTFWGWSKDQKRSACDKLWDFGGFVSDKHGLGDGGGGKAWDIVEVYALGVDEAYALGPRKCEGVGPCKQTVTLQGRCFHSSSVNYVFWGLANRLCSQAKTSGEISTDKGLYWYSPGNSAGYAKAWKESQYGDTSSIAEQAIDFTYYGYGNNEGNKFYDLPQGLTQCQPSTCKALAQSFDWVWEPNKKRAPNKQR